MKVLIAEPGKLMQKVLDKRLRVESFEVTIVDMSTQQRVGFQKTARTTANQNKK